MDKKISFYLLSNEADSNLEEIFDYTEKRYGFNQVVKYVTEFDDVLNNLPINPNIGRKRDNIKKRLRNVVKGEHIIFYKVLLTHLRIVKMPHGSRDLPKHFK